VEVVRNGVTQQINVRVTEYDRIRARIVEIPDATREQVARRRRWMAAGARSGDGSASDAHRITKPGVVSLTAS